MRLTFVSALLSFDLTLLEPLEPADEPLTPVVAGGMADTPG